MKRSKVTGWMMRATAILAVTLLVSGSSWAAVTWNVTSGDWSVGSNWDTGTKPGSSDTVYINNGGTATVTTAESAGDFWLGSGAGAGHCVVNSGSLTVGTRLRLPYSTSGTFTLNGGSVSLAALYIPYASGTGSFVQNGGTNEITSSEFNIPRHGAGSYTLNAGKLISGSLKIGAYSGVGDTGTFTQVGGIYTNSGITVGYSSCGTYNLTNGFITSGGITVGRSKTGIFNQYGGTNSLRSSKSVSLGYRAGGNGIYNLNGGEFIFDGGYLGVGGGESHYESCTGTLNQTSGVYSNTSGVTYIGYYRNSEGTYNLSGGRAFMHDLYVGYNGTGSFYQSGGTNTVDRYFQIGAGTTGVGYYEMSGGVLNVTNDFGVGYVANATGTFVQGAHFSLVGFLG